MRRLALIPSPFVGASSWKSVAGLMPDAIGVDYGVVCGPDWYQGVARRIEESVGNLPWIAVLHSGAGGFAPALASASKTLEGFIFVDAVLPYPGRSCLENAPADLAARLRGLTENGLLAYWNHWFPQDPTPYLLSNVAVRNTFIEDLPRVPFAFLEARSPEDRGWERLPAAYLQLSKVYSDEAVQATARGWVVQSAPLHHLAMASDPAHVARLLDAVVVALRDLNRVPQRPL